MNNIISKMLFKLTLEGNIGFVGWYATPLTELLFNDENAEDIVVIIPMKIENSKPTLVNITANRLPINNRMFGITYDLSWHPKYPINIPAKNTENITVKIKYVIRSIDPFDRNNDQKNEPTNRNTPNIINENIIINILVLSAKLSKKPIESLITGFSDKLCPHSVQNSISLSDSALPQFGQCLIIGIIIFLHIIKIC